MTVYTQLFPPFCVTLARNTFSHTKYTFPRLFYSLFISTNAKKTVPNTSCHQKDTPQRCDRSSLCAFRAYGVVWYALPHTAAARIDCTNTTTPTLIAPCPCVRVCRAFVCFATYTRCYACFGLLQHRRGTPFSLLFEVTAFDDLRAATRGRFLYAAGQTGPGRLGCR